MASRSLESGRFAITPVARRLFGSLPSSKPRTTGRSTFFNSTINFRRHFRMLNQTIERTASCRYYQASHLNSSSRCRADAAFLFSFSPRSLLNLSSSSITGSVTRRGSRAAAAGLSVLVPFVSVTESPAADLHVLSAVGMRQVMRELGSKIRARKRTQSHDRL